MSGPWRRPAAVLAALLAAAAAPSPAAAGLAVGGSDAALIAPPAGAQIAAYENLGYRVRPTADGARVEVEVEPLGSRAPLVLPAAPAAGPVGRLARSLAADADTVYAATSRILGWISRHLDYDLDRSLPQDAESVLARRSAYCTGAARLAIALLAAVGIEAREVPGYVAAGGPGAGRYHRWIEVRYPDRGWAFSDPLASHHYVPASYLPLAGERIVPPPTAGAGGGLLWRHDRLQPIDVYPAAPSGVRARRNDPRRRAAALRVEVGEEGVAVLEGEGRKHARRLVGGAGTFVDLEPGRYRLSVVLTGRRLEREIHLIGRERTAVHLPPPAPGRR